EFYLFEIRIDIKQKIIIIFQRKCDNNELISELLKQLVRRRRISGAATLWINIKMGMEIFGGIKI
nr:hypothetical protein [Tanacetum cinerariifolium]